MWPSRTTRSRTRSSLVVVTALLVVGSSVAAPVAAAATTEGLGVLGSDAETTDSGSTDSGSTDVTGDDAGTDDGATTSDAGDGATAGDADGTTDGPDAASNGTAAGVGAAGDVGPDLQAIETQLRSVTGPADDGLGVPDAGAVRPSDERVDAEPTVFLLQVVPFDVVDVAEATGADLLEPSRLPDAVDAESLRTDGIDAGRAVRDVLEHRSGHEEALAVEGDDAGQASSGGEDVGGDASRPDDRPPQSPGPADGAVVGVSAVATAAALRNGPVLVGSAASTGDDSGLLSTLLREVRPFVFPLRYSSRDDSDPLAHDVRERVHEIVADEPGSHLSAVAETAGVPLSTTRHHVRILEREGLLEERKLRGKRRLYPAYAEDAELAAAMADDSTAAVVDAVARLGGASVSDLAAELERDPSTVSHHLKRLESDGVVVREQDGRAVVSRLSAAARAALEADTGPEASANTDHEGPVAGGAD